MLSLTPQEEVEYLGGHCLPKVLTLASLHNLPRGVTLTRVKEEKIDVEETTGVQVVRKEALAIHVCNTVLVMAPLVPSLTCNPQEEPNPLLLKDSASLSFCQALIRMVESLFPRYLLLYFSMYSLFLYMVLDLLTTPSIPGPKAYAPSSGCLQ